MATTSKLIVTIYAKDNRHGKDTTFTLMGGYPKDTIVLKYKRKEVKFLAVDMKDAINQITKEGR